MKTTRVFASACLLVSSVALITAANISVGEEPGIVRLSSLGPQQGGSGAMPSPIPDPMGAAGAPGVTYGDPTTSGPYPAPGNYAPYFERSLGATEAIQAPQYRAKQPFGPILQFDSTFSSGLGFDDGSHRLNARLPYHVVPNTTVLMADLAAAVTNSGSPIYNYGMVYRNYDASRNRIFGWNVFGDYDEGYGNTEWYRMTAGFESLGKYIDFRANGYFMMGDDSVVLTDTLSGDLTLGGNNVFRMRNQTRDNAYSGFDLETGGPLPILGSYGLNMYAGLYYLANDEGYDTTGFQARWQALITESLTVNTYLSTDDTFGTNSWVNVAYAIPNYKGKRFMRPTSVQDRLQDAVVRNTRVHTHIDQVVKPEALVNAKTGRLYNFMYVDPNSSTAGLGTYESPFRTLQQAEASNNALVDMIRVVPNADDSGTNLTVDGGLHLYDCQILISDTKDFTLFNSGGQDFVIPGTPTTTNLGPLISNPTMVAGGSVVHLANQNQVIGMRIDGANAAGTVFGNGVSNALPIVDTSLVMNTFTRYSTGANLQDVSGRVVVDMNTFDGLLGASTDGLNLTAAAGTTMDLLVRSNIANDNSGTGLSIIAQPGSTINADNPNAALPTGILNNDASDNGNGIVMEARAGSTINAVVEGNSAQRNTFDGFVGTSDAATFNLASMRGNTFSSNLQNGGFIHYLNGGIFRSVSEDLNGNGILDAGEDLNGNGLMDQGIVSNTMNNNLIAGLCIFGEDDSQGIFDIGGPNSTLGNTFSGNTGGGVLVDLQDTATAQIDALFNTIQGGSATAGLTIVLDFIDPGQVSEIDINGRQVDTFNIGPYGFGAAQYDQVTNAIMATVQEYFRNVPTASQNPLSPIPDGQELNLDFIIGDTGVAPSNGATEYYVLTIGDSAVPLGGLAGQAGDIGNIRNALGQGPGQGLFGTPQANGASALGVYTNSINQFSSLLNPPNALNIPRDQDGIYVESPDKTPQYAVNALTSGNLTFTRRAIGLVTAHELGHALSLRHILNTGAVTQNGDNPIMGTPAFDAPLQVLVEPAEFALNGTNPGELPGEAAFQQNSVAQLAAAVGTRVAGSSTRVGIQVNATDSARLQPSTFNNNTITGATNDGIAVVMNDNAIAEGVTMQGNQITNGGGNGIRLEANGPGAFIDADSTIGGTGVNVYGGTSYTQGNVISNNTGDGFRALAANGATIHGNLYNNIITDNGGNGAALLIDNGGFVDFGTVANNRVIQGNTITGNGGSGIQLVSNVSATTVAQMDATVLGNTISNNAGGGIVSNLNGPNNTPPALPAVVQNNVLNLNVGGTAVGQANTVSGNGDVGIGVEVTGNGKAVVDIRNATITGTTDGPNAILNGDGINLRRADSALLLATVEDVTATGNAGDGLDVDVQGNDKNDPNQPMSGTVNTVNWNRNNLSSNGQNGARFRTRGEAMLIADGKTNTLNSNGLNGILVQSSETSTFGDATDGLPPGRRVQFDGNTINTNGQDGINILATEDSRVLLEVTSNRIPAASGAHAALNSRGDSSISNNGRDGIHIETTGGRSDVLITSGTGVTTISGNGTTAGGNGIRWDASGDSEGSVRVTRTIIRNNIAGATEVGDPNNNGDVDVADGDGIQANFSNDTTATLIVGGIGDGNIIQSNQDDGIAITATGSNVSGNPRPIISIVDNLIGGQNNGINAGNQGDGFSLNVFGGTAVGVAPANVDFTLPVLTFNGGVTESGAVPQLTMTGNTISQNNRKGANLLLTGASGTRDRENGNSIFDPVLITLDNNTIISNGEEGIFYRADSDMNQSRFVYLANFPDPPITGLNNTNYSPLRPEFASLNVGSVNGNTAYLSPYLNLRTVQNSYLTVTNNTIQNNGTNTVTGEGLFINVGTGSYVAADVQNNTFGGNLEADFRTASFLSAGNTFDSVDNTGDLTFDFVYLDDTAQFDLRFQTNTGNQIDADARGDDFTPQGAMYTNSDPLKTQFFGTIGVQNRRADLFQVENGLNLNDPNNTFINFGITQDIVNDFDRGGNNYNIRAAADPLFPNIGFAPFLP